MSTRSQVKVTDGTHSLTLYHHTDGYPTGILPLIFQAWDKYGRGWEGARVHKVASMLCATDPVIFEPLDYHTLHADIEYYYVINCKDTAHVGTTPDWTVTSYAVAFDFPADGENPKADADRLTELHTLKVSEITDAVAEAIENKNN